MAKEETWIVTASGDRPLDAVARDVAETGMDVRHVLSSIGSIVGHGSEEAAQRARGVAGVADVSPDHAAGIG